MNHLAKEPIQVIKSELDNVSELLLSLDTIIEEQRNIIRHADLAEQDCLHILEMLQLNEAEIVKVGSKLIEWRKQRRAAKNTYYQLENAKESLLNIQLDIQSFFNTVNTVEAKNKIYRFRTVECADLVQSIQNIGERIVEPGLSFSFPEMNEQKEVMTKSKNNKKSSQQKIEALQNATIRLHHQDGEYRLTGLDHLYRTKKMITMIKFLLKTNITVDYICEKTFKNLSVYCHPNNVTCSADVRAKLKKIIPTLESCL